MHEVIIEGVVDYHGKKATGSSRDIIIHPETLKKLLKIER